jgi:hypothetical protein
MQPWRRRRTRCPERRVGCARQCALFAGFGEPDGQRVILAAIPMARIDEISALIRRVCEERGAVRCELAFVPIATRWSSTDTVTAPPRG